jgi:hypothetical protein
MVDLEKIVKNLPTEAVVVESSKFCSNGLTLGTESTKIQKPRIKIWHIFDVSNI